MKNVVFILLLLSSACLFGQELIRTDSAQIEFVSEAPLELISARSEVCAGVIDVDKGEFAFKVKIRSFEGFNSPLQKEHFNENYMESDQFPNATFAGRFLEEIVLTAPGQYDVRAKGRLTIHNVVDERVIDLRLTIAADGSVSFESKFVVELETHQINVPRIVYQKIAEVISVTVNGSLK